jgi:hypothetical protein
MGRTVDARTDTRPSQYLEFSAITIRKRSIALFLMRLPALNPWIFVFRGWVNLNAHDVLTNTEADVLGHRRRAVLLHSHIDYPADYLDRRAVDRTPPAVVRHLVPIIGISDATTAAVTTDFAGAVFGRLAGHTFLRAGLLIITLAIPLLATANTPAQRKLGKYWKKVQRMTYVIWFFAVVHLLLLDGFTPFGAEEGDGAAIFHQRFYQALAVSIPLIILRLPPVRRWIRARVAVAGVASRRSSPCSMRILHRQRGFFTVKVIDDPSVQQRRNVRRPRRGAASAGREAAGGSGGGGSWRPWNQVLSGISTIGGGWLRRRPQARPWGPACRRETAGGEQLRPAAAWCGQSRAGVWRGLISRAS